MSKELCFEQSLSPFMGGVENVRSEKKENFHNLEGIFILALYYPSVCCKMALKYEARTTPTLALVPEGRWYSAASD